LHGIDSEQFDANLAYNTKFLNGTLTDEEMSNDPNLTSLFASIESGVPLKIHRPSMEFKIWDYILPLIGAFEQPESDEFGEENDWSPPENFKHGTSDEREIWSDFYKPKK
jgi:hypothetical protein